MMNVKKIISLIMLLFMLLPLGAQNSEGKQRYKIAACDWMMLKRQKIGSFQLMKELGGDGIEMDMGGLGKRDTFDNKFHQPHFCKLFKGEFYQFNLSSCIRQQNSLTAQFVSFSLSNLANIFYPPQFLQ